MKRALLISPPAHNQRSVDLIPIGLLSIAGYLREHDFAVKVYNSGFSSQDSYKKKIENTIRFTKEYMPDIVGIGFPSDALDSAIEIARTAKNWNKSIKIVVGGVHPTARVPETISVPYFDCLVHGEGEITMKELLDALTAQRDLKQIKGISFKRNGTVVNNEPRPEIDNLDEIPFKNRDLLVDFEKYPKTALGQIHSSRGCPYECAYCSSSIIWKKKVRYRSVINVISEIEYLYEHYRVKNINFADDNFTLDQGRVAEICEELINRKLKLSWRCCSRPDIHHSFTPEILQLMRKAGCRQICIGFESGDQHLLDSVSRGVNVSENDKILEVMKDAGIRVHVDFLIGLPGETRVTLDQTFQLMKRIWHRCRPTMNVALFKPYPGTRLCEKKGPVDHARLHSEYKKIFDFAELCNIRKLSRDPAYVGRTLLDNVAAPKALSTLIKKTLASHRGT